MGTSRLGLTTAGMAPPSRSRLCSRDLRTQSEKRRGAAMTAEQGLDQCVTGPNFHYASQASPRVPPEPAASGYEEPMWVGRAVLTAGRMMQATDCLT
jgi:hypothetical protein